MTFEQYAFSFLFVALFFYLNLTLGKIFIQIKKIADSKSSEEYRKQLDQREMKAKKRIEL